MVTILIVQFVAALLIALIIRKRISLKWANAMAIAAVVSLIAAILGLLFLLQVMPVVQQPWGRIMGWLAFSMINLAVLLVPFSVAGMVNKWMTGHISG